MSNLLSRLSKSFTGALLGVTLVSGALQPTFPT